MGNIHASYRERLSPSLWTFGAAILIAPMAALVFTPINAALSLAVGIAVGVLVVVLLVASSPVVAVRDGELRVGRAHIDARYLGTPREYRGDEARHERGPGLDRHSWHMLRGGIDGVVVVPIEDPADPVTSWVISTRTPDRLSAAMRRATAAVPPVADAVG